MKQLHKLRFGLAVVCLLTGFLAVVSSASSSASTKPSVKDWVISWVGDDWYQVQTADGTRNVCEGRHQCDVKAKGFGAGQYKVINLTTGETPWIVDVAGNNNDDSRVGVEKSGSKSNFGPRVEVDSNFGNSEEHRPPELGDVNGDGRTDLITFAEYGTYVSLGQANGRVASPFQAIDWFGSRGGSTGAGGWGNNLRLIGDVNGDGRDDIVGFGSTGVHVALGKSNGRFGAVIKTINNFGSRAGGWSTGSHPRMLGDVNGDGRDDIVGFADNGVHVALGRSNGHFGAPFYSSYNFGNAGWYGGWNVDKHPRMLGDVNGDGRDDIVGFADTGAHVALAKPGGVFWHQYVHASGWFGFDGRHERFTSQSRSGAWRIGQHPRMIGDVNGDGRADVIGFADNGAHVALGRTDGRFGSVIQASNSFGHNAGGWSERHDRMIVDVNGDGRDDIVGMASNGIHVALGRADGRFGTSVVDTEWASGSTTDWDIGDVNGDGRPDLVGSRVTGYGGTNFDIYVSLGE